MGFYGNIADTSRVHFQFDKIFSTRWEMEDAALHGRDGIFSGRFVLVKYSSIGDIDYSFLESNSVVVGYKDVYADPNAPLIIYADIDLERPYLYTYFDAVQSSTADDWQQYYYKVGEYQYYPLTSKAAYNSSTQYYTPHTNNPNNYPLIYRGQTVRLRNNNGELTYECYNCTGSRTINGNSNYPTFSAINFDEYNPSYQNNYNLDKDAYGSNFDPRGYDGTVWEKVYTGGNGKFVHVASLNSFIPDLDLQADAPSLFPSVPYIEGMSGGGLFRIHVPSRWGFRIKEDYLNGSGVYENSDEVIQQTYPRYDPDTNEFTGTSRRNIHAQIYFNKSGFNKANRTYSSKNNEILIEPTGASGKKYYDGQHNQETIDTYELSVKLPAIGNLVSDTYDKFYGYDNQGRRYLDTAWYNGDDERKNTGSSNLNGKTRDLNTVAGLINTFQDRLGQNIIVLQQSQPISKAQAQLLSPEYIYAIATSNGYEYYRIGIDYDYETVPEYSSMGELSQANYEPNKYYVRNNNTYVLSQSYESNTEYFRKNITYTPVTVTEDQYEPNTYYIQESVDRFIPAVNGYDAYTNPQQQLYEKNVSVFKFQEVFLTQYSPGTYFYETEAHNYVKDNGETPSFLSRPYYNITAANEGTPIHFERGFAANMYYKKDPQHTTYYTVATEDIPNPLTTYYEMQIVKQGEGLLYQPNKYYYYDSYEQGTNPLVPIGPPQLARESRIVSGRYYWYIPILEELTVVHNNGDIVVGHVLDTRHQQLVQLTDRPSNMEVNDLFVKINNVTPDTYMPISEIEDLDVSYEYYSINATQVSDFFMPNEYYTKDSTGYYLAESWSGTTDTDYYLLRNLTPLDPFYQPNKYHYYNGNIYVPATESAMIESHKPYYIEKSLYVLEDSSLRWPKGFEWREQAIFVPASVTLATKTEIYNAFEITGINNGESSINGAILAIQNFSALDNPYIRDKNTLGGIANSTRDILQSINTNLIPNRILYLNDFGQIATSSITISDLERLVNGG